MSKSFMPWIANPGHVNHPFRRRIEGEVSMLQICSQTIGRRKKNVSMCQGSAAVCLRLSSKCPGQSRAARSAQKISGATLRDCLRASSAERSACCYTALTPHLRSDQSSTKATEAVVGRAVIGRYVAAVKNKGAPFPSHVRGRPRSSSAGEGSGFNERSGARSSSDAVTSTSLGQGSHDFTGCAAAWAYPRNRRKRALACCGRGVKFEARFAEVYSAAEPMRAPSCDKPPPCPLKGNINAKGECIYHEPSSRDYERVVMENCDDQGRCAKGKRYFCSAAEAEAAGCRPPKR